MQILIVDDDDFALHVLQNTLGRMGYPVVIAHDGNEAMEILRQGNIRLVITDWDMPNMNGVDLCKIIRREELDGYVYIIMLTGREGASQRMEGLFAGADDFLNKPLDAEELLVSLKNAERILALETRDLALFAMAKLAESRDSETGTHVERVQAYSRLIAQHLAEEIKACNGIDDEYIRLLHQTSPLHDLGKVGIPDCILLKPGKLTAGEFAIMEAHTVIGAQTLDSVLQRFPNARFLQMAREIAVSHHERFDGSGYPNGLVGHQIPFCGRIVAIADVYDALTSKRVYKDAIAHERAMEIIQNGRGTQFDPEVVDAMKRAEPKILAAGQRLREVAEIVAITPSVPITTSALASLPNSCGILIVEDDEVILQQLARLIAVTGENVYTASNGSRAISLWRDHSPRVIISDWLMPGMDGVELCQKIRGECSEESVHFIMLTAQSDKARVLDAYRAGVDDFISKPFDTEELLARVRAGIRTASLRDELIRKATGTQALNAQLAVVNSRLERLAITDELTGLFNRRHAMFRLEEQWALSERYERPVTVALIDIDHFKGINDTYGHEAGDSVLRIVAALMRDQTRGSDTVCRIGGEEFLIISPQLTLQEVNACAERCRMAIANHIFKIGDASIRATVSIGLATRTPQISQFTDLLRCADQALYTAKHDGRNVVRISEDLPGEIMNPSENVQASSNTQAPIDMAAVLNRCGGDAAFASAVTERFRVQGGSEVQRIEQALASADFDTLHRAAHSLKSMAAYVSADKASELARQIEDLAAKKQSDGIASLVVKLREQVDAAVDWIARKNAA